MRRLFAICFLLPAATYLGAQTNFIANGDFETYTQCPGNSGGDIGYAAPWYDPTGASSDYLNACNLAGFNVPNTGDGFQYANSGVAFAGFYAFSTNDYREYIQAPLTDSLTAGVTYRVSFYVNLYDQFEYATNTIGAYLSAAPVNTMSPGFVLSYPAQVVNSSANPLISKINWMLVSDTFTAAGGEKFITIGNFSDNATSDTIYVGGPIQGNLSYYFVDDVSVIPDSLTSTNSYPSEEFSVFLFPNPASETVTVETSFSRSDQGVFVVYDLLGQRALSYPLTSGANRFTVSVADLPAGMYTWTAIVNGSAVRSGKMTVLR